MSQFNFLTKAMSLLLLTFFAGASTAQAEAFKITTTSSQLKIQESYQLPAAGDVAEYLDPNFYFDFIQKNGCLPTSLQVPAADSPIVYDNQTYTFRFDSKNFVHRKTVSGLLRRGETITIDYDICGVGGNTPTFSEHGYAKAVKGNPSLEFTLTIPRGDKFVESTVVNGSGDTQILHLYGSAQGQPMDGGHVRIIIKALKGDVQLNYLQISTSGYSTQVFKGP